MVRRFVSHGPLDEELIVSGALISGPATTDGSSPIRDAMMKNAFQAVAGAADPALKITKTLDREKAAPGLECWTIHAETTDGATLFLQTVVGSDRGVMIATVEGINQPTTFSAFKTFLKSIRQVGVQ